ncbi:hypothetical protein [Sediminibacillus albus]|uniref:Uncharacterized protein n=1 Tax=Sediminibacillus albus TaxID=407036 RepID=A0A1G8WPX4_9BACI|nr:hypothetical protein [Sediminibacillus albus]SDJ80231.1 hypothetical protein SAMN05216243_0925 [Sediminibacillus albus]
MRQLFWVALLGLGLVYYFADAPNEQSQDIQQSDELAAEKVSVGKSSEHEIAAGVDTVLATLEDLNDTITSSPDDTAEINQLGKTLSEDWDVIEKQVEENFPDDYKNIEDSLYPLIAYAQKGQPDTKQIKQLIPQVKDKLTAFKEKLSS